MDIIKSADGEAFVIIKGKLCKIVGVNYLPDFTTWATRTDGSIEYQVEVMPDQQVLLN